MPDARSVIEKMMAMATQDASPHERDTAREMLAARGMWPPPPHRPTTVGSAGSEPEGEWTSWTKTWKRRDLVAMPNVAVETAMLRTAAIREARSLGYEVNDRTGIIREHRDPFDPALDTVTITLSVRRRPFGDARRTERDFEDELRKWTANGGTVVTGEALRKMAESFKNLARDFEAHRTRFEQESEDALRGGIRTRTYTTSTASHAGHWVNVNGTLHRTDGLGEGLDFNTEAGSDG